MAKHVSVYASAARTATPAAVTVPVGRYSALHLVIDTTTVPGSAPSTVCTIDAQDPVSGKFYNLLTSAAIIAVGTVVLKIGRGLTAAANAVANDVLPSTIRVTMTHGNANSVTYTVAASLIP